MREDELKDRIEEIQNEKIQPTPHIKNADTYHDTQNYTSLSASNLSNENDTTERQLAEILESLPTGINPEILQRTLPNEIEKRYAEDEPYYEDDAEYEYEYDDAEHYENDLHHESDMPYEEIYEQHHAPQITPKPRNDFDSIINYPSNLKLIIDIQNSMKAQNSIGYKIWCEKFNLEQMSQTLIFIEKHQLTFAELQNMATRKPQTMQNIKTEIEALDEKMQHISLLQRHIGTLDKTKEIFRQYAQSNYSSEFRAQNLKAITANEAAKKFMYDNLYTENFGRRIPPMHELKQNYAIAKADKNKLWAKFHDIRNGDNGISNAWENVKTILVTQDEIKIEPPVKKRNPYRSNSR